MAVGASLAMARYVLPSTMWLDCRPVAAKAARASAEPPPIGQLAPRQGLDGHGWAPTVGEPAPERKPGAWHAGA